MDNRTRLKRLYRLRGVVELHKGQRYRPVKLNGDRRSWNMHHWDCGSSACALGSYALTPYGKRYFYFDGQTPVNLETGAEADDAGADHFGLSPDESRYLFFPEFYQDADDAMDVRPIPPSQVIRHIETVIRRYERGKGDMQQ